jgi:Activator of Hsp90 ATPase homolog 1-like protein
MSIKDDSRKFDFEGIYTEITLHKSIEYTIIGGRKVIVSFVRLENEVVLTESFEPETINSHDLQVAGWQAILDNFKKYVEIAK